MFTDHKFFSSLSCISVDTIPDQENVLFGDYLRLRVFSHQSSDLFDIVDGKFRFFLTIRLHMLDGTTQYLTRSCLIPIGGTADFYMYAKRNLQHMSIYEPMMYLGGAENEFMRMAHVYASRTQRVPHYKDEQKFIAAVGAHAQTNRSVECGLAGLIRLAAIDAYEEPKGVFTSNGYLSCATERDLMTIVCPEIPPEEQINNLMVSPTSEGELKESLKTIIIRSRNNPDLFLKLLSERDELRMFISDKTLRK